MGYFLWFAVLSWVVVAFGAEVVAAEEAFAAAVDVVVAAAGAVGDAVLVGLAVAVAA